MVITQERITGEVAESIYCIYHFTTFHSSYLIIANIAVILENIRVSDLIGANFAIGCDKCEVLQSCHGMVYPGRYLPWGWLNLYVYCRNNLVYYVDPSGHICFKELVRKFVDQGMSEADVYEKAKQELHKQLLKKYPGMSDTEVNKHILKITDNIPANDYGYWKQDADGNYVYTHKKRTNKAKQISDDELILSQVQYEQYVLNANGFRNVNGLIDYRSRVSKDASKKHGNKSLIVQNMVKSIRGLMQKEINGLPEHTARIHLHHQGVMQVGNGCTVLKSSGKGKENILYGWYRELSSRECYESSKY